MGGIVERTELVHNKDLQPNEAKIRVKQNIRHEYEVEMGSFVA